MYETPQEAHESYLRYKYKLIKEVALTQKDPLKSSLLKWKLE